MMYDLFDQQGYCRWSGQERAELLAYLAARSRRPPRHGTRPYSLHVRTPGQPAAVLSLAMHKDGRIVVKDVRWSQPVPSVPLEDAIRDMLFATPPVYTPPAVGRSVWQRLRDRWPRDEASPVEAATPSVDLPPGITLDQWHDFLRWNPSAGNAGRTAEQ